MSAEENKALFRRAYEELWNRGNLSVADELIAPGAPLTGVKVLGCTGSGSNSGVIKGVDWVTANATKPAIANMSLGAGGVSQALDDALRKSASSGVFYSVVAGNKGEDACNYSPARAGAGTNNGIMTVAATDEEDRGTSWSNYGPCVDLWAPGARILSTKMGRHHDDGRHLHGRSARRRRGALPLEEHERESLGRGGGAHL